MKVLLVLSVVIINVASDVNVTVDLCSDSSNYESYTKNTTQNCGCTDASRCIRKCCQKGFYLRHYENPNEDVFESICIKNESNSFNLPVYNLRTHVMDLTLNDTFMIGMLNCGNEKWQYFRMNDSDPMERYFVQENGTLYYPYSKYKFYNNSRYCVDEQDGLALYLCFTPENPSRSVARLINSIGMLISIPFLLLTFIVFAVVPNGSVHRRGLMCYSMSLLLACTFLVTVQLHKGAFKPFMCQAIGYSIIFFFLASFFWMNVLCFDTWFAFGGLVNFNREKHSEKKRFVIYCMYAWGLPLVHIILVFLFNTYGDPKSMYYPGVGKTRCFLEGTFRALFVYFYGPLTILIGLNIVLFLLTSIKIQKIKRDAVSVRHWTNKRRSYEYDRRKYHLYLKLLLAMGINWSLEIVSWAVQLAQEERSPNSNIFFIWYISDFCNAIYGMIIFLIFVYRKPVWKTFKMRVAALLCSRCRKSYEVGELQKSQEDTSSRKSMTSNTDFFVL